MNDKMIGDITSRRILGNLSASSELMMNPRHFWRILFWPAASVDTLRIVGSDGVLRDTPSVFYAT